MAIKRPYRRTCRPFVGGSYHGAWLYIRHPSFCLDPDKYIRSFLLLQEYLKELFDYIEPSDKNWHCFSFRTHSLLMRACIEIEANFKAILRENDYKNFRTSMNDYTKLEASHHLSEYEVRVPYWHGELGIRRPFQSFAVNKSPVWYKAYNDSKHDRHHKFAQATFGNAVDSLCGLAVILSAQFCTEDFGPSDRMQTWSIGHDEFESAIGRWLRVKFPANWPRDECYVEGFANWNEIRKDDDPFRPFPYK